MSLTFDFPNWHVDIGEQQQQSDGQQQQRLEHLQQQQQQWADDLQDLSGDEDEQDEEQQEQQEQQQQQQQQQQAQQHAADAEQQGPAGSAAGGAAKRARIDVERPSPAGSGGAVLPDALLLLLAGRLSLADTAALGCACRAFRDCLAAAGHIWQQHHTQLLGGGWPWPPFVGSRPATLPASLGSTPQLRLKATLAASKVALRLFVMRKGYAFLLEGWEALWAAAAAGTAAAAAAAVGGGGGDGGAGIAHPAGAGTACCSFNSAPAGAGAGAGAAATAAAGSSSACSSQQPLAGAAGSQADAAATRAPSSGRGRVTHVDELWQEQGGSSSSLQIDPRYGGRQLQRMVTKLAGHSWQLTYEGYSAALAARADELAAGLRAWQQQQQGAASLAAAAPASHAAAASLAAPGGEDTAAAAAAVNESALAELLPAAALADCAGGILSAVEAASGGRGAGEMLAAEPELLLAATRRGARPAAALVLWQQLLSSWGLYRRWLDLTVTRCAQLGARVAAARQLAEPPPLSSSSGGGGAGSSVSASAVPQLRNKGLMLFRSHVLLACGLRRPLQQAALWMAATAAVDAAAWRAGGGLSEADLELLTQVRKMLRELDVGDDGSEPAVMHTHGKFRRCFGALLTRERLARGLEWGLLG
uniref:F-box domain-containing protein n=1 Tax=Tetradesmus obliquus TaxID=3088 RepID=A0A383VFI4_TETOB|eukprot:jgi/Sobl393_1/19483/SZX64318.1